MPPHMMTCVPPDLHPVSRQFLDSWLAGDLATATFRRLFHLPNSAYIDVAECLVTFMGIAG